MAPLRNACCRHMNDDGQDADLVGQDGGGERTRVTKNTDDTTQNGSDSSSSAYSESDHTSLAKPVYTSQLATLFIILNVTVGTGLLAMPFTMQTAGIVTSMIAQVIFLILAVITCLMCIELTIKSGTNSYHELIQKYCHPYFYQLTQVSIFVLTFAVTVAYIVVIGDQSDRIFASCHGPTFCRTWYMNRNFVMIASTLLVIRPLCSAKTVDFLKYASFLGLVTIGFIFYVIAIDFSKISAIAPDVNFYPKSWPDVISILPVICLGYHCHLSLVPTVATIQKKEKRQAFVTVTISMILAMIIYSGISVLAILTFGSAIQEDLTQNFEGKGSTTLITILVVAFKCALTMPAVYLSARLSLVDILVKKWPRFANYSERVQREGVTVVFLLVAAVLAISAPDILVVVNLIGCLAVMFVFCLPGMAYISLVKQNRKEKQEASGLAVDGPLKFTAKDHMKLWMSYFLIVFGILMTCVVLYTSIAQMLITTPTSPLCHDS